MNVNVTARHFELTDDIREHVVRRVEKIEKFGYPLLDAHVVLDVEKRRQIAEVSIHGKHSTFTAQAESHDMIESIDDATDKVQNQIRRHAEKVREHRALPDAAG